MGKYTEEETYEIYENYDYQALAERCLDLEKEGFVMSAELSWKDRLIKEYETIVNRETQIRIKKYIFSEDDR